MDPSLSVLPVFVALFLGFVSVTQADQVPYCRGTCPEFTLLERKEGFELREYVDTVWICTVVRSDSFSDIKEARGRLVSFSTAKEMDTDTWPVRIKVMKVNDVKVYKLCWFVNPKDEATVLSADRDVVEVDTVTRRRIYVRCFGGTPSLKLGEENANILTQTLDNAKRPHDNNYSAEGYESYFSLQHNNEILEDEIP